MKELCLFTNVSGEQWAAWAQAILSAVAIFASVWLAQRQRMHEQRKQAAAESGRRMQQLRAVEHVVRSVSDVLSNVVELCSPAEVGSAGPNRLFLLRTELEGLVDVLRQADYGRFDDFIPIDAQLVAMSVSRQLIQDIVAAEAVPAPPDSVTGAIRVRVRRQAEEQAAVDVGERAKLYAEPLNTRLQALRKLIGEEPALQLQASVAQPSSGPAC